VKKSLVTVPSAVNEFDFTSLTDTPVVDMKIFVLLSTWVIDGAFDISFIGDVDGEDDNISMGIVDGLTLGVTLEVSNVALLGDEDEVALGEIEGVTLG